MKKTIYYSIIIISVILIISIPVVTYLVLYKGGDVTTSQKVGDTVIPTEPIFTMESYPRIDGSTATQPLAAAFMKNFTGVAVDETKVNLSKTHDSYVKLINGELDLILVTEPSAEELALAKEKGVELEVIPVVREGFVFFVNKQNKIESLTLEQIQKIYTGEITNWSQVGGDDVKITAYQRPVNSGSQTGMLSMVMKGKKMMEAPKEYIPATMSEIINLVSNYNNELSSIGYSYYYYATIMYDGIDADAAKNIKLIGVNGIKPNNDSIKSEQYPLTTSYYIVINKADSADSASRKLAEAMLSPRGQRVAQEAKYVPVK